MLLRTERPRFAYQYCEREWWKKQHNKVWQECKVETVKWYCHGPSGQTLLKLQ